ncbi:MAG: PilZ domain-containing protein [Acidobacteriota bacterium]
MSQDRRTATRVDLLEKLAGELSVMAPVAIREIGPAGVRLESAFPLLVNSLHDLRLHLDDDVVVVKARVVHCQIADLGRDSVIYRAGLEFVDLPERVKASIVAFVLGRQEAG